MSGGLLITCVDSGGVGRLLSNGIAPAGWGRGIVEPLYPVDRRLRKSLDVILSMGISEGSCKFKGHGVHREHRPIRVDSEIYEGGGEGDPNDGNPYTKNDLVHFSLAEDIRGSIE